MRVDVWLVRVLALMVGLLAGYITYDYFRSENLEPFSNVQMTLAEIDGREVRVKATFDKNQRADLGECQLDRFRTYGLYFGEYKPLKHSDLDGRNNGESREAGAHSLNVKLFGAHGRSYEKYQLRTRHLCPVYDKNGNVVTSLVSRVFLEFVPRPVE